jgi:hypothetical protein
MGHKLTMIKHHWCRAQEKGEAHKLIRRAHCRCISHRLLPLFHRVRHLRLYIPYDQRRPRLPMDICRFQRSHCMIRPSVLILPSSVARGLCMLASKAVSLRLPRFLFTVPVFSCIGSRFDVLGFALIIDKYFII